MKVLQLCKKFPYPLKDGESIAVNYLSRSLVEHGCTLDLLSVNTPKHFYAYSPDQKILTHYRQIETIFIDTDLRYKDAFLNLFSPKSYHICRFESKAFEEKLLQLLQVHDYDVVLLESIFVGPYLSQIRKHSRAKIILRAHNVEFKIWERVGDHLRNPIKISYLRYLTRKLKLFELDLLKKVDGLIPISPVDADVFTSLGFRNKLFVYPVCLYADDFEWRAPQMMNKPGGISFIGSLDWIPNQEGLYWFVSEVWPLVRLQFPDVKFYMAGRHVTQEVKDLQSDSVILVGEVESSADFLHTYPITVVPLFSGSGMRVKIIEAMALGPLIVSTSIGAEGIAYEENKHVLIADTPEDFAAHICSALSDPQLCQGISEQARELVQQHYNASVLGSALLDWLK